MADDHKPEPVPPACLDPSPACLDQSDESSGTLLGGRVLYKQKVQGYRTGIEPVLLAASIPAKPGDRIVEGGSGAGAGLLCLAARIAGLIGLGLEIDPDLVALASRNLAANGLRDPDGSSSGGWRMCRQDVVGWAAGQPYDHAFANPPWHREDGTRSPFEGRLLAKTAGGDLLQHWATSLAAGLRRRGTLSLILPADALAPGVCALQRAGCPEITMVPLWPHAGQAARLVILRGVHNGRGGSTIMPGLVLHAADGSYTAAAEAVLRSGLPLP